MQQKEVNIYILCIYDGITLQWSFYELSEVMLWVYKITGMSCLKDAIAVAWMKVQTIEDRRKLGMLRDFYVGQFDNKLIPRGTDLERIYQNLINYSNHLNLLGGVV